jgi:hypothetical protein
MGPANVDPVECARLIVYACRSAASGETTGAGSTSLGNPTPHEDLSRLAVTTAEPFFPPNVALTLVCVLSSVAVVAWSIATQ